MSKKIKQIFVDGETYDIGGDALPKGGNAGDVLTKTFDGAEWNNLGVDPFGDGSDGDFTKATSGTCYLDAREYNFNNFTHTCGTICFKGEGVPVIRVKGKATLSGYSSMCLYENSCCGEYLKQAQSSVSYKWSGPVSNIPSKKEMCGADQTCYKYGGNGNGRGGDANETGCSNKWNGTTKCAGGAATTTAGGGGGGYTTAGGAASSGTGGCGGCSSYGAIAISVDTHCSGNCCPGSGGGGYGSTAGGAGGKVISTCVNNCYLASDGCYRCVSVYAGSGGDSLSTGGAGGCNCICNLYRTGACAGKGGKGYSTEGGSGGRVYVLGGCQYACGDAKYISGGCGGDSFKCGGDGGKICFCGAASNSCGIHFYGGNGGAGYNCYGGCGGDIGKANTIQITACNYVCAGTYDPEAGYYGGRGGDGKYGGDGGYVQFSCCNSTFSGVVFHGGDGGDGICRGGNGGNAFIGCGVILNCYAIGSSEKHIKGGNGGNAIGGNYSLLIAAKELKSSCDYRFGGSGGDGGCGGNITNRSGCPVSGYAGNGGNGSDGSNVTLLYGKLQEGSTAPRASLSGGAGGLGGTYEGCFTKIAGGIDGLAGKNGTFVFAKLD